MNILYASFGIFQDSKSILNHVKRDMIECGRFIYGF